MTEFVLPADILSLQEEVRIRMSEKRFLHSIGVAQYAYKMAMDAKKSNPLDYYIAGILHDVAKEIPKEEQLAIMKMPSEVYEFREEDLLSPTLYHGFCAPYIVLRDFPQYAKREILFAICYHTVGRENMSFFEKVIFLSDYIEPTRTYPDCIIVRNMYEEGVNSGRKVEQVVDSCLVQVLDNTLSFLQNRDYFISTRTHKTRDSILATLCLG